MTPSDAPARTHAHLRAFRVRALRSTAVALVVVNSVLVVIFAATAMVPVMDLVILGGAIVLHAVAAATVGRRWGPGAPIATVYVLVIVGLVLASLATSTVQDTEGFWFLLIPVGLSGIALRPGRHLLVSIAAGAGYLGVASTVGGGATLGVSAARLAALAAFGWVAFAVTRRLEEGLDREVALNERLRELDQLKDDFVSTVSHELRTPLTVILGLSATVNRRWDQLGDGQRRMLSERIEANARSLEGIITSLLDVARIERGQLDRRSDPVDLDDVVRTSVDRLELLLREHPVSVDSPRAAIVLGDRTLLERVLDNLVTNAARHTPPGTPVSLRVDATSTTVRVEVRDEGPGIPAEALAHLGERFFRAGGDEARANGGVGVGLTLVSEVLQVHGSRMEVTSTVGEGACFAFELPTAPPDTGSSGAVAGEADVRSR